MAHREISAHTSPLKDPYTTSRQEGADIDRFDDKLKGKDVFKDR
jgi:hypothetical protein